MKFPFQRCIVCWGKVYGSKIIGGPGAPSHLRLLFCKIVYVFSTLRGVQYRGGIGCSVPWGYPYKCGDILSTVGCSVQREDVMGVVPLGLS